MPHGDADCQAKCNQQHKDSVGPKRLLVPLKDRGFRKDVLRRRLGNGYCHTQDGTQRVLLMPIVEIERFIKSDFGILILAETQRKFGHQILDENLPYRSPLWSPSVSASGC